jgi:hypothetical protein
MLELKIIKFAIGVVFYASVLFLAGTLFDVWPSFFESLVVTIAALLARDIEEWFERKMKS